MIKLKRIYEKPSQNDGYRVLVDRLWPRGLTKNEAKVDLWLKDIAPSKELRKWFNHEEKKWDEFKKKYKKELENKKEVVARLKKLEKEKKALTLLYSAKNKEKNNAAALLEILGLKDYERI